MLNRISLLVVFGLVVISGCASHPPVKPDPVEPALVALKVQPKTTLLDHKYFQVYYDSSLRLARYVKYTLTEKNLKNSFVKRKDHFVVDPIVLKMNLPAAKPAEYAKSGYDKGHMAPTADFLWDKDAMNETFVMSNMAPQKPNLNRNAWRLLELQVRKWACGEEQVTIFTGPIFDKGMSKLKDGLTIPQHFFKVVFDDTPPYKVISFIYNQTDNEDVMQERIVPLAEVTEKTGFDFAGEISKDRASKLRAPSSIGEWKEAKCW